MSSPSIDGTTPQSSDAASPAWADLSTVPTGLRSRILAAGVDRLFRRAARKLDVRVEYPDGTVIGSGKGSDILPRMIIRRPEAYVRRLGTHGLIGFGEAYMAGDWTSPDPAAVLTVFATKMANLVPRSLQRFRGTFVTRPPASERGSEENTRSNISRHYDLSNDLFELFLDETMTYSSALFTEPRSPAQQPARSSILVADHPNPPARWEQLAGAQQSKIDRLLDAAGVRRGTRLLEIGTGWGELCIRAAERGAIVRSVTLSSEQQELARRRVAAAGFADTVQIDLLDYRAVEGEYDAIVSVEMIEAVGHKYWQTYFEKIDSLLAPGGQVSLQAITMPHDRMLKTRNTYTWVQKYIFPGGFLPSAEAIESITARKTTMRVRERLSMGSHYAETLRLWQERFGSRRADALELGFDETFCRMWQFYLAYSEAGFRAGYIDVQQLVLDRGDILAKDILGRDTV
ncbi:class I SAM-dependent methyltransferase [Antrihabitans cavernicola]|uniref:Methyltransferase domain-containing protein n=1 Tax=Antrihabitans cavernicola TaxID=2495913 RepID=A0A5A7S6F3_9NOCA|nr:class I SAM-dependent methyltransferase [Spelaeibacter cavernicola]KAA0021728.1 methyltransferase domain-containing protein [Spelaeibacter cavernicola]